MKKSLVIFTAVCAIISSITLASCSNMLDDLRNAGKKKNTNSYTITFDSDGGSNVEAQKVGGGKKAQKPDDPIKICGDDNLYDFQGWYNGETKYDFDAPVNADIKLKAKWNEITITSDYTGEIKIFGSWPQSEAENIIAGNLTSTGKKYDGENEEYKDAENNYYVKVGDKYYKVEPIKWRVIAYYSDGSKLLLADKIYSRIPYYGTTSNRDLRGTTIYSNNYKYSNIRAYLNSIKNQFEADGGTPTKYDVDWTNAGFLTSAFTSTELAKIKTVLVDNSAVTTDSNTNQYACENTEDKVYLLSYKEAQKKLYDLYNSSDKIMKTTAYARANGAYQSDNEAYGGYWWLRSPSYSDHFHARRIDDVDIYGSYDVNDYGVGIVPALTVTE